MVKSEQAVTVEFTTANPSTGAAANADSLPTGVLVVDGADTAAVVTVTNVATGVYKAAVNLPVLTAGQLVGLRVNATVGTVAGAAVVWQEVADTARVSDVTAKTNSLPSDPADQSLLAAAIAAATVDFTPVLEAIAALPDDTDVTAVLAALALVKAKTDTIGATTPTVVTPVTEVGAVTLYQAADYDADDSRSVDVLYAATDVPDLTGATVQMRCAQATWTAESVTSVTIDDVVTWRVRFEYAASDTAALTAGHQDYQIWATLAPSGHAVPLSSGTLEVEKAIPAA